MVELREVEKSFAGPHGRVRALNRFSLKVEPGESVAVRGPSGSGKTTLLLIVGGLLRPDSGEVRVCGESVYDLTVEGRAGFRARRVGFVFQQFHLLPYLTVRDNVLAATLASKRAGANERAESLLSELGLGQRLDHLPGQLSTGERQRCALARAMLQEPGILLADEPTGNLDAESGSVVLDRLAEYARRGGTVLLATHDDRAAARADRVVHLGAAGGSAA